MLTVQSHYGESPRRFLFDLKHLDVCVPTQDTEHDWLQCWLTREMYERTQPIKQSVKLLRLKQRCRGQTLADVDHAKLLQFAVGYGETSGRWNLKTNSQHVDALWRRLVAALLNGTFGGESAVTTIKCSTKRGCRDDIYMLCVYGESGWTNKAETMRVRDILHQLDVDEVCIQRLYFRPELYTYLPFNGKTYVWIDGKDTGYHCKGWNVFCVDFEGPRTSALAITPVLAIQLPLMAFN